MKHVKSYKVMVSDTKGTVVMYNGIDHETANSVYFLTRQRYNALLIEFYVNKQYVKSTFSKGMNEFPYEYFKSMEHMHY